MKIRIITDDDQAKKQGFTTTNEARSRTSNRNYLNRMREVGIPIRTDASPAHMHNKFCIVDGDLLVTGSFNWTMGAALRNQENIVVVGAGAGAAAASVIPLYKQEFLRLWHTFGRRNAAQYDPSTVSRKLIPAQPQGRRYDCLFFPDAALPCRHYARGRCHNPNCRYAHGETGLTRMVSYLESAQTSLDVCVLTITCDEVCVAAAVWLCGGICVAVAVAVAVAVFCVRHMAHAQCGVHRSPTPSLLPTSAVCVCASSRTTSRPSAPAVTSCDWPTPACRCAQIEARHTCTTSSVSSTARCS